MPLLVNKIIFGIVPSRAPFILRPLLRSRVRTVGVVITIIVWGLRHWRRRWYHIIHIPVPVLICGDLG